MRKEYDFTKSRKNPYAAKLKKQITNRVDKRGKAKKGIKGRSSYGY